MRQVARALVADGFEPGDKVAVLGFNRPEWTLSAVGAMAAGGAGVGVYTTSSPDQVGYVLHHSRARVVVVENARQLAKLEKVRDALPHLRQIVLMEGEPTGEALAWDAFLERGAAVLGSVVDRRVQALDSDDLATLIYTSGTTGEPKAVMLSHGNILETVKMIVPIFGLSADDVGLSYLPLAHIAEQMMTIHMPTWTGCSIHYVESPEKILENLREVRPTVFFGVPRVWERFAQGVEMKLAQIAGPGRKILDRARRANREVLACEHRGESPGFVLAAERRLGEKLVTGKILAAIGFDRLRLAVSGAAPIAKELLELWSGLGIGIYEVWGLSETSGPATWNRPGQTKLGTVGPSLPGVEVKLAEDGEILLKGPNIFRGYLDNPEANAEAFGDDGFFKTGDIGTFDDDGYLLITGRKKNLLITSGGKNIAPEGVEKIIKHELEAIAEAVVVGDGRRFVAALLSLDPAAAMAFAHKHGLDPETLHETPELLEWMEAGMKRVNARLSRVESVRAFRVLPRPLSVEEGELTPTLKVRRDVVEAHWAKLIEEIYAED